jgi:hypothetical protein
MESTFRNTWTYLVLAFMVLALCLGASAQVVKGSISGTVVDPTGAAVAGAEAKASNVETGQVATTTTDNSGLFKLSLLSVGTYRVEVSKTGFRKTSLAGVGVTPGVDAGLGTVKLEIGSVAETVEVTAATPLVETTQSQITSSFDNKMLTNLPGIQENQGLDTLAALLPGVSGSRDANFANTNGGGGFTSNGLRGRSNDQQLDGQNNNDNSVTGPQIFVGNGDFVDQYQITTNNFGAEYGRNAGSVVNVITKAGTNTWHGTISGTESNSALDSLSGLEKTFQGLTKPSRYNDEFTGATIGGPWLKNKIFFFGGFDDEIISSKIVYGSGSLTPDPAGIAAMAGCYPGSTSMAALQAYGPYAIAGNPTVQAPHDVLLTAPAGYVGFVPNNEDGFCHVEMGGVQRTITNSFHEYDWIARTDITGARDTVYGRYYFQHEINFNTNAFSNAASGYPSNVPSFGQQYGVSWVHKFSDHLLNELRLNYGRLNVEFGGNTLGTVPSDKALTSALANVSFSSSSLLGYGPATNQPQGRIINTYQLQDNLSYVKGRHQIKAGVNYTYQLSPNPFLPNANGRFNYADWSHFGANFPSFTAITLGPNKLDFKEHDSFFYVGDDWKVTQHLTVNLGLTYSYYGQPANLFHDNTVRQQTGGNPFWDPTLPLSVTTFPNIPAPKNSFGPSIGFAYTPGWGGWLFGQDKTVFRGGYRLSYDPPFYNIYLNISSSAPQVLAQTIQPGQPMPAAPFGPAVREQLAPFLVLGVSDPRSFAETNVTPKFSPDRVHSWSFGVQRELSPRAAFEIRYVGNHGQNLFQSINANPYIAGLAQGIADGVYNANVLPAGETPCSAENAVVPSAVGRVNCNEGRLRQRTNTAYSNYNGMQAEFRTNNIFNQLTMKTNFTWSKTTDNATDIFGQFAAGVTYAFSQNPQDFTHGENGLSGLDFPKTWTVTFNEEIPVFKQQHGVVGKMFGGWSVAGTYILQSGQTFTPVQFFSGSCCGPYNNYDTSFDNSFNSGAETARPFLSNPGAPAGTVGMYAGDACNIFFGDPVSCGAPPTALIDYSAANASATNTGVVTTTVVDPKQVHFIVNSPEAQAINGTPFGSAPRNSLRDAITNSANFQLMKTIKFGERVRVAWHMSMVNAFNHRNAGSIDPFIEDAGLVADTTGFANPAVQDQGHRTIRFGLKVAF